MVQQQTKTATCGTAGEMLALAKKLDLYNNGNHYINWTDPNQPPPVGGQMSLNLMQTLEPIDLPQAR